MKEKCNVKTYLQYCNIVLHNAQWKWVTLCIVHLIIFPIITSKSTSKSASDTTSTKHGLGRVCVYACVCVSFTESDEVCAAAFGKWPCFVILNTFCEIHLRAHYLFYKWMCGTWDTWWSHHCDDDLFSRWIKVTSCQCHLQNMHEWRWS